MTWSEDERHEDHHTTLIGLLGKVKAHKRSKIELALKLNEQHSLLKELKQVENDD